MPEESRRVVILTALKDEYDAVRSHLTSSRQLPHQEIVYELGSFIGAHIRWEVLAAEIGEGEEVAATEAQRAIDFFHPEVALFVGVAGGVKDVKLADVVVAKIVKGYETGADGREFKPRAQIGISTEVLIQRARFARRRNNWRRRLTTEARNFKPTVFVAPIAAGSKVVKSRRSATYKFISSALSDCLAVEMEGIGFLTALNRNRDVAGIVVRGISDLIAQKAIADRAGMQRIASKCASAFAFEILSQILPQQIAKSTIEPIVNLDTVVRSGNENAMTGEIVRGFTPDSRIKIEQALSDDEVYICAFPSVSPTNGSSQRDPERCFHLGHYYFATLFERILDAHGRAALLICPSRSYHREHDPVFNRMMCYVGLNWLHCFGFRPRRFEVDHFIYTQPLDKRCQHLLAWLSAKEQLLDRLSPMNLVEIRDWRSGSAVTPATVEKVQEIFGLSRSFTANQILALAYVLIARPRWFTPDWFVKSIASFVQNRQSVQNRLLGTHRILIIEAEKNMTTWEPLAICAEQGGFGEFPPRAYFENVPSAVGKKPMRSADKDGTVFLYQDVKDLIHQYDEPHLLEIAKMFDPGTTRQTLEPSLRRILDEGAHRLRQRKAYQ